MASEKVAQKTMPKTIHSNGRTKAVPRPLSAVVCLRSLLFDFNVANICTRQSKRQNTHMQSHKHTDAVRLARMTGPLTWPAPRTVSVWPRFYAGRAKCHNKASEFETSAAN